MEGKIYHASPIGDLKELIPRISSHGKPYVYGTKNFELALFFGSAKTMRDLDGKYGTKTIEGNNFAVFSEAYVGALKRRFKGESCYVYELDPTDFEEGKTSFRSEVVSEKPVKVLKCTKIDDIYEVLMKAKKAGKVELNEYSLDEEYQAYIIPHIKICLKGVVRNLKKKESVFKETFNVYKEKCPDLVNKVKADLEKTKNIYKFCQEKFPELLKEVEESVSADIESSKFENQ